MIDGILKKPGKIIPAVLLLLFFSSAAGYALELEANIDYDTIGVGESTALRITLPGSATRIKPVSMPKVRGLEISYSGKQSSFKSVNGKAWSELLLTYSVTALKKGKYTISPFVFEINGEKAKTAKIFLTVSKTGSGSSRMPSRSRGFPGMRGFRGFPGFPGERRRRSSRPKIELEPRITLSTKKVYAGEPVVMRYYIVSPVESSYNLLQLEKHPELKGFVIKQYQEVVEPENITEKVEGKVEEKVKKHYFSFVSIPAEAGKHTVGGGSVIVEVEGRGSGFFNSNRVRVSFPTDTVEVLPLPEANKPADFQGDVGHFSLSVSYPSNPVNVFEEKRVAVTVAGVGNIVTLSKPVFNEIDDVKVLAEEGELSLRGEGKDFGGEKKFIYTVIPERVGTIALGSFKLSFFNPGSGKYETAKTEPVSFEVTDASGQAPRKGFDVQEDEKVSFNPLYIVIILLLVIGGVVFVILWERKRYSLVVDGNKEKEEKEQAPPPEAESGDYLSDIRAAIEGENSSAFLSSAEKALDLARKKIDSGGLPEEHGKTIDRLRDRIHTCRFGGGRITGADMTAIYEEIRKML
ncbi:MAG: protein BatD [bacterium]|nr:protein BatD [bacterium]